MGKRPGARLDVSARRWYLDRSAVARRIGRANAKALAKVGSHIRRTAQTRMLRRRKRASRAGEPPSVHARGRVATLRNIQFFYSAASESLVVGPVLVAVESSPAIGPAVGEPAPEAMEFGTTAKINELQTPGGEWVRATRANRRRWPNAKLRSRRVAVAARPFMGPSLEREADKIPAAWRGTVG